MTDLPAHLSGELPQEAVFYHNWLYSVVPVGVVEPILQPDNTNYEPVLYPYLIGYCKNCNNTVSVRVDVSSDYGPLQRHVGIPKEGCVAPAFR